MMLRLCPRSCSLLMRREGKECIDGCLVCVFFLLSSRFRMSFVSVVFDFNASLNDIAPVSPILLSVDEKRKEKSDLLIWMSFVCLLSFVFTAQNKF